MEVEDGWHLDPFGLHEHRYFSRGKPTKLVMDDGRESYDAPPAVAPEGADSEDDAPVAASGPTPAVGTDLRPTHSPNGQSTRPPSGATAATSTALGQSTGGSRSRRRVVVLVVAVLLLVGIAGVAYGMSSGRSNGPGSATSTNSSNHVDRSSPSTAPTSAASVTTTTPPPTSTTAPSPPTTAAVVDHLGSTVTLKAGNLSTDNDTYSVQLTQIIDPATPKDETLTAPIAGDRLVALVFTIANNGPATLTHDANSQADIIGSNGVVYTTQGGYKDVTECTDFGYGGYVLRAGDSESGCVVCQVPATVAVAKVEWSSNDFMAPSVGPVTLAEWYIT